MVGGGPAGAAAAITLRRAGCGVVVLQPAPPVSFRVGESVPPEMRVVLDQLGLVFDFPGDGHLTSRGNASAWGSDDLGYRDFLFDPLGHGWHLDRPRFDATLLSAARSAGAVVVPWRCVGAGRAPDGRHLLACQAGGAPARRQGAPNGAGQVVAEAVVDASGRRAVIGTGAGARRRVVDRLVGVTATFEMEGMDGYGEGPVQARTLVEAAEHGWWYAAPVPGGRLVVTLMSDGDLVRRRGWADPAAWETSLAATVHVRAWAAHGRSRSPLVVTAAGSHVLEPAAGRGWAAAGDAACALDPLSSAGILTAVRTGREAAEALLSSSSWSPSSGESLAAYDDRIRRRFTAYLDDRRLFYRRETRWDSEFWARRRGGRHQPR